MSRFLDRIPVRWLRAVFWAAAVTLGFLQTWKDRINLGEDGVSYLDLADLWRRGEWHAALNAYWSPMYSWVLAGVFQLVQPSLFSESLVVHLVNFALFVVSLAAFEYFLNQLLESRERAYADPELVPTLTDGALRTLGYVLFVWSSLVWLKLPIETPDILLTVWVYLAAGLLLRIRRADAGWTAFALLGVCLGLGYLTKSVMFPVSFVFLGVAWFADRRRPGAPGRFAVAVVAFAVVAAPWVVAISTARKRVTFGDTGRIAYVAFANGYTERDVHWGREFPDENRPVHPTRRLMKEPPIYGWESPLRGTYGPWFDPSYWHEGEPVRFELRGQLHVIQEAASGFWHMLLRDESFLPMALFIAVFASWRGRETVRDALSQWVIIVPSLAAMALYTLVLFSPRYVAVFAVLLYLGVFAGLRRPARTTSSIGWAIPLAVMLAIFAKLGPDTISQARGALRTVGRATPPASHHQWQVAQGARAIGLRPGDPVAIMGYGADAYWARLAGLHVVGEVFSEEREFESIVGHDTMVKPDGSLTDEALAALKATGAKGVVARKVPDEVARNGWTEAGKTGWYFLPLYR